MKRELGSLPGVEDIETNVSTQLVQVRFDPQLISADEVKRQLGVAGFPAD